MRRIEKYRKTLRMARKAPDGGSGGADTQSDDSGQEGTPQGCREGGTRGVSNTDSVQVWGAEEGMWQPERISHTS